MARAPAQAEQAQTDTTTQAADPTTQAPGTGDQPKRRRVNRGARGPQPIYLFVKNDPNTGKLVVSKSFRDPRKMAQYFEQAAQEGAQFLVTTPE